MRNNNILKRYFPSAEGRKWIYSHTKKRIPELVLLTFCRMISACIGAGFALVTKDVINTATAGDTEGFVASGVRMLVIILIQIVDGALSSHLSESLFYSMDGDLKECLLHSILNSDYEDISAYHSGNLLYRLNSDVSGITSGIIDISTSAVSLIAGLVSAAVILISISPFFAFFMIPVSIILACATFLAQRNLKEVQKDVSRSSGRLSGFMQEIIENLLIIQGMDVSEETEKKTDALLKDKIRNLKRQKDIFVTMNIGSNVIGYMGSFATLLWCAYMMLEGKSDYGSLVAVTTLVSQLQSPLLTLPSIISKFTSLTASTERVIEIDRIKKIEIVPEKDKDFIYDSLDSIEGENLNFVYKKNTRDEKKVLADAGFRIRKGGITVITGASGSGKSTLMKLLLGIYHVQSGELQLKLKDGTVIPVDRSTRGLFAYAPQNNLLLSGTIRENIMIANRGASEEELQCALYVSCMKEYVEKLPKGLDTVLGENGAGLSEGQIQRVNLARAVLSGAPVLLLDEVTSALDIQTEKMVLERINGLQDKTCIVVTHRPAVLEMASQEMRIKDGRISEITH